jgi:5'-3' exoribonuclease 2
LKGNNKIWQGVFLLPFVDEQRLQKAIGPLLDDFTEDESIYMSITFHVKFCKITFFFSEQRNTFRENQYFVSRHHQGYDFLRSAAEVASHGNASHTFIPERKNYNMKDFSHFKFLPGKVFLSRHCVEAGW